VSQENRHTAIKKCLNDDSRLKTFDYAVDLELYFKDNCLKPNDIICIHKGNVDYAHAKYTKYTKSDERRANATIQEVARNCTFDVPVFKHTGADVIGNVSIDRINKTATFHYNWLLEHIKQLMDAWQCSNSVESYIEIIEHILDDNKLVQNLTPLDILIQGYLTIYSAATENPWVWLGEGKSESRAKIINQNVAKQRLKEIEQDPYKWFEPAIDSLKELFPPENPDSSKKFEEALGNLPNFKKLLLTKSELIEFSKFISRQSCGKTP